MSFYSLSLGHFLDRLNILPIHHVSKLKVNARAEVKGESFGSEGLSFFGLTRETPPEGPRAELERLSLMSIEGDDAERSDEALLSLL